MFWEAGTVNQTITTGAAQSTSIVSEALLEAVPNATLVRVRGEVLCQVSAIGATPSASLCFMGLKLVTASAFAAGGVAQPGTDQGSDWLWWYVVPFNLTAGTANAPDPEGDGITVRRVVVDSKAMRKTKLNELLVFVSENVVVTSTQTHEVDGAVRVLFKR